jgi:hypothetical protein
MSAGLRENQQGNRLANRIRLQRAQGEVGLARRAISRTIRADSHCSTAGERTTRTTATADAASPRSATAATAAATSTPHAAAEHAAPARLHVQLAEPGAEHVIASCAAYASSSEHVSDSATATPATPATTTTAAAATKQRRKTEQKDAFGYSQPDVRQSRLQFTPASIPGRVCCAEFGVWTSTRRSVVGLVRIGRLGRWMDGWI